MRERYPDGTKLPLAYARGSEVFQKKENNGNSDGEIRDREIQDRHHLIKESFIKRTGSLLLAGMTMF